MMRRPVEPAITEYLHTKASRLGIPLNGTFELTPLCNMNCRMCYVRMGREQQEANRTSAHGGGMAGAWPDSEGAGHDLSPSDRGRTFFAAGFSSDHAGTAQDGICYEYQLQRDSD